MFMNGTISNADIANHFSQRYVAANAAACPVCGHSDIEADPHNHSPDHKHIHHFCECHGCGSTWTEVFVVESVTGLNVKWTSADQTEALRQGWGIFATDDGMEEIQRHDEAEVFDCDNAARHHVLYSGVALCRKAVAYLQLN
ncbi:MAG TPA: hypothetical protein PLE99_05585 [Candidatus Thiothrix moscowensis]|uniref:hypothetical protein n=1 Tax=unclassified Thiothrix TaxID=2636184 RepID=UPI0025CBCAFB|nr:MULTISPECIES: hypothetical protein [unclassified Thiothrix]HRJ52215.1 hypothetical protein [Candidatus Thiothrix moscowensis]HRJ92530.1 hypothetical protein [Candidatus Thiothrix moscowensis]